MKDQTVYAVVDIETTGTNPKEDKIIQFACVFVQNREIINYFSTDINPLRKIPKQIEKLTGISNKQIANAPYFEDIAPTIVELLSDCVFVAHNVYFDFSFLNSELVRAKQNTLSIKCIDTVELAQILFPSSPGFRVHDLAEYLSLDHTNPHQAISDAYTTAEIFVQLLHKINTIPLITLNKMVNLSKLLGVDNYLLFEEAYKQKEKTAQNSNLFEVKTIEMISLRIKSYNFKEKTVKSLNAYPAGNEKYSMINEDYRFREPQSEMMDSIYRFVTDKTSRKNLLIEAGTGIGKTLGYLFPLSYLIPQESPIILSTSTILLQEQLIDSSIPYLEELISRKINSVVVKGSRHFIDLEKFYKTLMLEPSHQKHYIISQMAVLVWLIETNTGDLDELTLNKNNLLFEQVRHHGRETLNESSLFVEEDFITYMEQKKERADLIILNHAFLCEEDIRHTSQLPECSIMVVDEAHKLIPELEKKNQAAVSFRKFYGVLRKMDEIDGIIDYFMSEKRSNINKLGDLIQKFSREISESLHMLEMYLLNYGHLIDINKEVSFELFGEIPSWPISVKKNIKSLLVMLTETNELIKEFFSATSDLLKKEIGSLFFQLYDYTQILEKFLLLSSALSEYLNEEQIGKTKWVMLEKSHLILYELDFSKMSIEQTSWYNKLNKIIFTSGTLQLSNSSCYFENQLMLPEPEKIVIKDMFSYEEKAKLIVITDGNQSNFSDMTHYVAYLADAIINCYNIKKSSMLVLFTSHEMIKLVYHRLQKLMIREEVSIFAQNITGTKEKLIKRFKKEKGGIILGANSFWEGVDLNLSELELILMVKLPFDPPTRPLIEAKYRYIESMGKNAFYEEAIPQAGGRLRQGLGRLLRTEQDRGMILIFDHRLTRSNYSNRLLDYLPKKLPVEEASISEAILEINSFLTGKDEKN